MCNKYNPVSISPADSHKINFSISYFGQQSEKLKTELLIFLSKYFKNIDLNIGFLRHCVLLSYINFVVHDMHLSTLGPLHVLYTREPLSMLKGVSELVLFCLFIFILWLGLTPSHVVSLSLYTIFA